MLAKNKNKTPHYAANALIWQGDHILLIRNRFGLGRWTLPGGGIDHGEQPHLAAIREVHEELQLPIDLLHELGFYQNQLPIGRPGNYLFAASSTTRQFKMDYLELRDAKWFHHQDLPDPLNPLVEFALYRHIDIHTRSAI